MGTAVLGYFMTGPYAHLPDRRNFFIDEIINRDDTVNVSV
jgi:hypothetical protein